VRTTFKDFFRKRLALDDTPERIALAFAVGVFLAFSPLLGLHTVLGIAIAFIFGLNRVAVLLGVFVNNPWTLVPIYTAGAYLGELLVDLPPAPGYPDFGWSRLWTARYWVDLAAHWRLLVPVALGSTVLAVLVALLSYPLALYVLRQRRGGDRSTSPLA